MKAIFYVPNIDEDRFHQNIRSLMDENNVDINALRKLGLDEYEYHAFDKFIKRGGLPSIEELLTIAHFFNLPADNLLFPKPHFVCCEMNVDLRHITPCRRGIMDEEEVYLAFSLELYDFLKKRRNIDFLNFSFQDLERLCCFSVGKYHTYYKGLRLYNSNFHIEEKKLYIQTLIDKENTYNRINYLLKKNKITDEMMVSLLGYASIKSIKRWHSGDQKSLPLEKVYKLCWILNIKLEDLIVCDYYKNPSLENNDVINIKNNIVLDRTKIREQWYRNPESFIVTNLRITIIGNTNKIHVPDDIKTELKQVVYDYGVGMDRDTAEKYFGIDFGPKEDYFEFFINSQDLRPC